MERHGEVRARPPGNREAVFQIQLRSVGQGTPVPVVRHVRGRGEDLAGAGPRPARLRLHPQMLARL